MPPSSSEASAYEARSTHSYAKSTALNKRQQPADQDLPYPPPLYTPSIPLHASIIPLTDTSGPAPTAVSPGSGTSKSNASGTGTGAVTSGSITSGSVTVATSKPSTTPAAASQNSHATNSGLLAGVVTATTALLLLLTVVGWYMIRRKAKKLKAAHPRFSMFNLHDRVAAIAEKFDSPWSNPRPQSAANEGGQFVFISTSADDIPEKNLEKHAVEDTPPLVVLGRIGSVFADDTSLRRHSSPAVLEDVAHRWLGVSASEQTRPLSLPPPGIDPGDDYLQIQRQKAKELTQMMRMKIVANSAAGHEALPTRSSLLSGLRRSMTHGLGIVHEGDEEADIGSTPLASLHSFRRASSHASVAMSLSTSMSSPVLPITELFDVDPDGRIVRLSTVMTDSPASPASDGMPATPSAPSLDDDDDEDSCSVHSADSSVEDLRSAVVLRAGRARSMRARSMEFAGKRPILVSVHTTRAVVVSPPASHSAPLLGSKPALPPSKASANANAATAVLGGADTSASNSASTISAFPSPPPMLSPIFMSPTAFAEDVSQSVEERMFAHEEPVPWARASYRYTVPGPIRA